MFHHLDCSSQRHRLYHAKALLLWFLTGFFPANLRKSVAGRNLEFSATWWSKLQLGEMDSNELHTLPYHISYGILRKPFDQLYLNFLICKIGIIITPTWSFHVKINQISAEQCSVQINLCVSIDHYISKEGMWMTSHAACFEPQSLKLRDHTFVQWVS